MHGTWDMGLGVDAGQIYIIERDRRVELLI